MTSPSSSNHSSLFVEFQEVNKVLIDGKKYTLSSLERRDHQGKWVPIDVTTISDKDKQILLKNIESAFHQLIQDKAVSMSSKNPAPIKISFSATYHERSKTVSFFRKILNRPDPTLILKPALISYTEENGQKTNLYTGLLKPEQQQQLTKAFTSSAHNLRDILHREIQQINRSLPNPKPSKV